MWAGMSVCATSTSPPACVKHRRAPRPVEARRLYRGRPRPADLQHSSHCCLITTVKWLGRELSSYPIDLSNASESGGQSLSRAMRVFSAYSAYIGLELERFCTDGRRSRRGHEEGEEKPSGTHLSASDVDGGHVARSR